MKEKYSVCEGEQVEKTDCQCSATGIPKVVVSQTVLGGVTN